MKNEDLEDKHIVELLVTRNTQGLEAPTKDRLWSWGDAAKWRASVVRKPAANERPKGKFDGGLGPKRAKARDYDGPGEICENAQRSWV